MKTIKMKYGTGVVDVSIPEEDLIGIIESSFKDHKKCEEEIIKDALENPIGSPRLRDLVKPGQKICIVVSDITRNWQRMNVYLPYIVEELNKVGIEDKDIIFLVATGSHREQTEEEHKAILGDDLYRRIKVVDHDCRNKENLVYLGTTSFGTPVRVNKIAMECDHVIITGAIIYHFLAGYSGGRKSILPGICGYETIMANHARTLSPIFGEGTSPLVGCARVKENPVSHDMQEACSMVKPTFLFNVIIGSDGTISHAVSGDYIKAHEAGCKIVDENDGVYIDEKADLVIASSGGYPKDMNLYQASKAIFNSMEAVKDGGSIVVLAKCQEGFGNKEVEEIIGNYATVQEREKAIRERFSIPRYIGYYMTVVAEKYNLIIVGDIDDKLVKKARIRVVKTIEEALKIVYKEKGQSLKTYLMPHGGNILPKIKN